MCGSRGWGDGDGVAEGLQLANVVALESVRVDVFGEVIRPQIDESRVVVGE
jgi:hypothetical protein